MDSNKYREMTLQFHGKKSRSISYLNGFAYEIMVPEYLEVYLGLHLDCYLANSNPLRPFQDLPGF